MDFDQLLDEAWPSYEREDADGWILRWADGVTKRANSVLPWGVPEDLEGAIERAEKFYADRGLPCVFSIGSRSMPGIDEVLGERGYRLVDEVSIMKAGPYARVPEHRVRVEDAPWDGWMESWWAVDGRFGDDYEPARRIATGVPARYAAVEEDGVALAVGRAVPQGDVTGIYCMATLPQARRRGLARSVLRALAGDGGAYLVVTRQNVGAQAFYRSEGFDEVGAYHYRVK
ncbi:GNAT family N-acetyltransferase [Nonomuraea sp. NPDC050556]|uniref:GNAT family N-acetyltransferase n=1 Tax=Nonomuraea sp. NPDC050556 TaxID=3364369 RepID=UPI0037B61661